jgi:hypothetical protein
MENDWKFVPLCDSARRQRIEAFDTFDKVLQAVCAEIQIVAAWICEGTDLGPKNCWRPVVQLDVGRKTFDAFFNSPGGYRAQYLLSPEIGQAANGRLLRLLEVPVEEIIKKIEAT